MRERSDDVCVLSLLCESVLLGLLLSYLYWTDRVRRLIDNSQLDVAFAEFGQNWYCDSTMVVEAMTRLGTNKLMTSNLEPWGANSGQKILLCNAQIHRTAVANGDMPGRTSCVLQYNISAKVAGHAVSLVYEDVWLNKFCLSANR